jgi:hypothetical protein
MAFNHNKNGEDVKGQTACPENSGSKGRRKSNPPVGHAIGRQADKFRG